MSILQCLLLLAYVVQTARVDERNVLRFRIISNDNELRGHFVETAAAAQVVCNIGFMNSWRVGILV